MRDETPRMPSSQAEWEAHWAFYKLTVQQRDDAWAENVRLVEALEEVAKRAPSVQSVVKKEGGEWVPLYERCDHPRAQRVYKPRVEGASPSESCGKCGVMIDA